MLHARLRAIAKLACPTALLIAVCALTAPALAATTHALPKISGKVTTCHKKLFKIGAVTYTKGQWTMGSLGGKPLSGPLYGWAGGGIVVFLENPSG